MIALALALLLQREPLPAYADAVRCAGITAARYKMLGHYDRRSNAAFDASVFWSMTAMERARKDNADHAQFERDVAAAAAEAEARLARHNRPMLMQLKQCVSRVPR